MDTFKSRDLFLKSFKEIPRAEQKVGKDSAKESDSKQGKDMDKLLGTYEKIPREKKEKTDMALNADKETSKEELAIRDMRRILYFLEKKVRGTLAESDEQEIKASREQWENSMKILCEYAEGE